MSPDISPLPQRLCRRRVARLGRRAARALGAVLALVALGGCAEDPPAGAVAGPVPDAGPACEVGSLGCACPCGDALLCIAGRCLLTEGPREIGAQPAPRPRPAPPPSSLGDAAASPPEPGAAAADDAGAADAAATDAG